MSQAVAKRRSSRRKHIALEYEATVVEETVVGETAESVRKSSRPKRRASEKAEPDAEPDAKKRRLSQPSSESGGKDAGALARKQTAPSVPPAFEEVYGLIVKMRAARDAPVDMYGTEAIGEGMDPRGRRLAVLMGAMLSSQTKDAQTAAAVERLKAHGLTVPNLLATSEAKLKELLYGVGFHNNKATYIKKTAVILHEMHGDDVPSTLEELIALPGVGPKMAYLVLNVAFDKPIGICVDVHVHRIVSRLGWVRGAKTPEDTRKALEGWLPREKWVEINLLLVGFGQQICLPVGPRCSECLAKDLCPKVAW